MKLPKGVVGFIIATDTDSQTRCALCYNRIRTGDRIMNPHPGVYTCRECWSDETKEELDRNRPALCPNCNLFHNGECW